ncbi:MAG: hypothetical protein M1379_18095 [Firmicutes bacterium]|nr:hypothetical protein [Bacillota bacterium]
MRARDAWILSAASLREAINEQFHRSRFLSGAGWLAADLLLAAAALSLFRKHPTHPMLVILQFGLVCFLASYLRGKVTLYASDKIPLLLNLPIDRDAIFLSRYLDELLSNLRFLIIFVIPATAAAYLAWGCFWFSDIVALTLLVLVTLFLATWLGLIVLVVVMRFLFPYRMVLNYLFAGLLIAAFMLQGPATGFNFEDSWLFISLYALAAIMLVVVTFPAGRACYPRSYLEKRSARQGSPKYLATLSCFSNLFGLERDVMGFMAQKDLLLLLRQPFIYLRLGVWVLLTLGFIFVRDQVVARGSLFTFGVAVAWTLGVMLICFIETQVNQYAVEANRINLFLSAPVKGEQLIKSKLLTSLVLLLPLSGLTTLMVGLAGRLSPGQIIGAIAVVWLAVTLYSTLLSSMLVVTIDPEREVQYNNSFESLLMEQIPLSGPGILLLGAIIGFCGLIAFGALFPSLAEDWKGAEFLPLGAALVAGTAITVAAHAFGRRWLKKKFRI